GRGRGLETEGEYVEPVAVRTEPEALVEAQGGGVVDLGVDERELDPSASHPVQPVEHEGAPDAGPLVVRVHRQPLDVTAPAGSPGDRVRGQLGAAAFRRRAGDRARPWRRAGNTEP